DVKNLDSAENRREKSQQVIERKNTLDQKIGELEKQIDRTPMDRGKDEKETSRKMADAAGSIRDNRLRDRVRYSASMVRAGVPWKDAQALGNSIGSGLDTLKKKLADAASSVGKTKPDTMTEALDKARQLTRGMDSLDQRTRERAQRGQQGQQGDQ